MDLAPTASTGQRHPHSVFAKVKAQETERHYKAMKENEEEEKCSMISLGSGVTSSGSKRSYYDLVVISSNDVGSGLSFAPTRAKKLTISNFDERCQ